MNIIVTGGCGFIGSHIVDRLIEESHSVTVIDNLSAKTHKNFYYNDKAKYLKLDITQYDKINKHFENIDYVFHCAAQSRIQESFHNPMLTIQDNIIGTVNILQSATDYGIKKVIYSSTSSAYGNNQPDFTENMNDDCLNIYSTSKVCGEKFCDVYQKLYSLQTITLRYFNVYGPREPQQGPYATVIQKFFEQKNKGHALTVVGNGEQQRDFTYIEDVVSANIKAMHSNATGLFNIGTNTSHKIIDLAKMISDNIEFIPARSGEAPITKASINKAQHYLDWKPTHSVIDYIKYKI